MRIKPQAAKNIFLFLIAGTMLFSQVNLASAQTSAADYAKDSQAEESIIEFLCTPKQADGKGETLFECINKIYKFTIAFASAIAVLFIVIAGWVYMSAEGSQEKIDKAKEIVTTTIVAMIILLGGYVLLKGINPDLVQFRPIQPLGIGPTSTPTAVPPAVPPPTATTKQLASQILAANDKIILASSHVSKVPDNATAIKNIEDTAAGKAASLSKYENAPGGTVALNQNMLNALLEISKTYKIGVSEIAGGSHSENSNHYKGTAFDINYVNDVHMKAGNQYTSAIMNLCRQLGATEVLDETASANHVHCAWSGGGSTPADPAPSTDPKALLFLKPWTGTDPYPDGDYNNTKPELRTAVQAFSKAWQQQGGNALQTRQIYRPAAYQNHLRSVWEVYRIENKKDHKVGYGCAGYEHLDPVVIEIALKGLTSEQKTALNAEYQKHSVSGPTPPACKSDHSDGIAVDITPPATAGTTYQNWIKVGESVGLCHYIAGDAPHFALKQYLPTGTNCLVP